MKRFFHTFSLLIVAIVVWVDCSKTATIAGNSSSETTNGITAVIRKIDGSPVVGAMVRLRRSDYVSQPGSGAQQESSLKNTVTDAQGRYQFYRVDTGSYCIEASLASSRFSQGGSVLFKCSIGPNDSVDFGTDTLHSFAFVKGTVDSSTAQGKRLFVQVLGLERLVAVDSSGKFMLNDLPSGNFSLRIIDAELVQTVLIRSDQVSALAGDTVGITMAGWSHAKMMVLNTTAGGAGVSGNVVDFPVLVRLTQSNFDFSQAQPNGADIRFSKENGKPLTYEIEQWDAVGKTAVLWVKVDTVYGNDSSQFIMMYCGNSNAASESNGEAVFDTANGFQGVWHMGPAVKNMVPDATINHYDGTLSDTAPTATTGAIGICRQFNGMSNYIRMLGTASSRINFPENGTYSVSAWVYVDTLDTTIQKIIEKNNLQYKLQIDQFDNWSFSEYENATGYDLTNSAATAKTWVFLVGIRSGLQQYLYVNGVTVNSTIAPLSYSKNRDTTTDLAIGKSSQSSYGVFFNGKIDEARVENRGHGADWILLCYMNQRPDDRLVVFRP